jgi:hypothetical protein
MTENTYCPFQIGPPDESTCAFIRQGPGEFVWAKCKDVAKQLCLQIRVSVPLCHNCRHADTCTGIRDDTNHACLKYDRGDGK